MRDLVHVSDMTREWWEGLYSRCRDIIARPGDYVDACKGKVLATLFYEPSTRTNFSFQSAMQRLGGTVFGFSDPMGTSVAKGETLADTIRIAAAYSDTIVIRSPQEGAAAASALYSDVPIINAGDGSHMHPTQTLADLTTICEKRGAIGSLRVGLCGDLKYGRTVHSLVEALASFPDISYTLISPTDLQLPPYMIADMERAGHDFVQTDSLADAIAGLDVLYMTRVQRERFSDIADYDRLKDTYILTQAMLAGAKPDLLIMHPLPRQKEISPDVDGDPRAAYFEQARFGMFIRMALLLELTNMPRGAPPLPRGSVDSMCCNPACVTQSEFYLPQLISGGAAPRCMYCDSERIMTGGRWRVEGLRGE
ncbi:MAG: aspartate carbamoyltransferase [Oscillospiraceae bacterium]|nr:aspartate carbamoyltransferase [Oscillospiraceae bacterium]